jgi:pimeloyl-ACP methyl ester carboxylesterase
VFDNAGHWPHLEDREAFDTVVLEWIRAHEARR